MRKLITFTAALIISACAFAQSEDYNKIMDVAEDASLVESDASAEFPYSKILNASDSDLKAQRFKFDSYRNCWTLSHSDGWNVMANIISDINTPGKKDYRIAVQNGKGGQRSYVQVTFFDPEIYHTILAFAGEKGENYSEGKFGKGTRYTFNYAGYVFTLEYSCEEVKVTRTTTGSSEDRKISTSRSSTDDYSYDKYVYTISTGVPAESDYMKAQALKDAKRQAKGKKARSSEAFL